MGETSGPEGPVREVVPKPLEEASRRLRGPAPNRKLSDEDRGIAIGLAAVGVPSKKIAGALKVSKHTIDNVRSPGWADDKIKTIRETLKLRKMKNALRLEDRLWNLVDKKIDAEDAKAVDGVMRAIHASEKIQQTVAGESIKVEQTGNTQRQDLAGLIQVLIQEHK